MKNSIVITALVALSAFAFEASYGQATANQNLTLAVNAIYKIATSGNPGGLTISTGSAGTDALTSVSDASTTYSMTQNFGNTVKITANLDAVLTAGYKLEINLASSKGTSAGTVDISNATSGSAATVVSSINVGADAGKAITYTFSANASAGTLASTAKVVTLTLTN